MRAVIETPEFLLDAKDAGLLTKSGTRLLTPWLKTLPPVTRSKAQVEHAKFDLLHGGKGKVVDIA